MSTWDYSDAEQQLTAWTEQARRQQARAAALQSAATSVVVRHWSPGRDVCVTVGSSGLVQDIELTERALAASALTLGRTITATAAAARAELAARLVEAAEQVTDADDPMLASFRAQQVDVLRASAAPAAD
jgi:hypothetical protein